MALIVVAHGKTGTGKTEVANYLHKKYNFYHFHPIRYIKEILERLIGAPEGYLETPEGKALPIPGNNNKTTVQELLVALFHFGQQWIPSHSALNIKSSAPTILANQNICFVSLRAIEEAQQVVAIAHEGNHKLLLLDLYRNVEQQETSDLNHSEIRRYLLKKADSIYMLNNNESIETLHKTLDDIMGYHV
jgi:hypothetical protein